MTNILINTKIVSDNKTILDKVSDNFLCPTRYLFHGRNLTLHNGAVIGERESFPQRTWVKTAAAITALIPSLLLGTASRLMTLTSSAVRNDYQTAADYLNDRNIARVVPPRNDEANAIPQNEPYNLENSIAKITDLAFSEKKLCLFIGRQPHEELPHEEDEVWVSLDQEGVDLLPPGRLHLQINANNQEQIERIQNLFDKVVLDWSCLKFFRDPWRGMGKLLKPLPTSELITEDTTGMRFLLRPDEVGRDPFQCVHDGNICIHMSDYIREARETGNSAEISKKAVDARYYDQSTTRMQEYQRTLFHDVEFVQNQPYPYWNRWTEDRPSNYFVLRHPNPVTLAMSKEAHDALIMTS
ncbi:MAG: hypothetical protein ACI9S8_001960 [Chlamydiales bacterium]|jgi:hypothetical protein